MTTDHWEEAGKTARVAGGFPKPREAIRGTSESLGGGLDWQVSQGRAPEEESTGVVRGRLARGKSPGEDRKWWFNIVYCIFSPGGSLPGEDRKWRFNIVYWIILIIIMWTVMAASLEVLSACITLGVYVYVIRTLALMSHLGRHSPPINLCIKLVCSKFMMSLKPLPVTLVLHNIFTILGKNIFTKVQYNFWEQVFGLGFVYGDNFAIFMEVRTVPVSNDLFVM